MNLKKLLIPLLLISVLTSCGDNTTYKQVEVITNPLEGVQIYNPAPPRGVDLLPVHWTVLTKARIEELLSDPEYNGEDFIFYALTPDGYKNLSFNTAELKRYIKQQKAIILYYRRTTTQIRQRIDQIGAQKFADELS